MSRRTLRAPERLVFHYFVVRHPVTGEMIFYVNGADTRLN
jgi:hypothetical protein